MRAWLRGVLTVVLQTFYGELFANRGFGVVKFDSSSQPPLGKKS
jgi:hypothetical protein